MILRNIDEWYMLASYSNLEFASNVVRYSEWFLK